jgi:hypothetical protein
VYRDARGVEYVSVPLPSHEVTDAVPLEARLLTRRTSRPAHPLYEGTDGEELAAQPRSHRKRWTDAQWGAYEEHRRCMDATLERDDPVAVAIVVKPRSS